jgi:hypothetical protein
LCKQFYTNWSFFTSNTNPEREERTMNNVDLEKMSHETGVPIVKIAKALGIQLSTDKYLSKLEDPNLTIQGTWEIYDSLPFGSLKAKAREKINELCLRKLENPDLIIQEAREIYNSSFFGSRAEEKAREKINELCLRELDDPDLTIQLASVVYHSSLPGSQAETRAIREMVRLYAQK